jgi:hypothetical protein
MGTITVREAGNHALHELGVLAAGETGTADDLNESLEMLNLLVDQWAAERLMIFTVSRTTCNLIPSQQTYTVGTGGDFNVPRPVYVDHVTYINNNMTIPIELRLTSLTDDAWAAVPIKDQTVPLPDCYYYNPTFDGAGWGTLKLWKIPTLANLVGVLYAPQQISEFTGLDDVISLPPGYRRMIVKNLACDLADHFGRQPSKGLIDDAYESKLAVKVANGRLLDMAVESAALGQTQRRQFYYSIYSGP